jgi:predicted amidohydrolase YtcJ
MKPIQAKIEIINSKIKSVVPFAGGVLIKEDNKEEFFKDAYVLPGFVDSHCHIWGLGLTMSGMPLHKAKSPEEIIDVINKNKKYRGNWLFGRGWNQELWYKKEYPDKEILDKYFPDVPVLLTRIDGHADWVNSKVLQIAGINKFTPDPPGGEIIKDSKGEPTGLLIDNAMQLAESHMPHYSLLQLEEMIKIGVNESIKVGLTELHDMDVSPVQIPIFKKLDDEGYLPVRVRSYVSAQNNQWLRDNIKPYNGRNFSIEGIKFFADGALGSHGAALLKPYSDKKDSKGLILLQKESFLKNASLGIEAGFQVATHAIGDAAVRFVLDAYEILRSKYSDAVLRIEHSQMIDPDDLLRFKELNIIAAVQPIHCISDAATMAEPRLGLERCEYSYRWKSLISNGIMMLGGSDFPIESHNPLTGIDAFIHRKPIGSIDSWMPEEMINIDDALDTYTINNHKLFPEKRGELLKGFDADFVVLKNNSFEINTNKVLATYVAGNRRF